MKFLLAGFAFRQSIRRKIIGVAVVLIILMIVTSVLTMSMSVRVSHLVGELTERYIPAYSHLARANVRSLERALALRQAVIARMSSPPDDATYAARLQTFNQKDGEVEREATEARRLVRAIVDEGSTLSDNAALARIEARIESAMLELRRQLAEEDRVLLQHLESGEFVEVRRSLARVDLLRDQFIQKVDAIRADMFAQVVASTSTVIGSQRQTLIMSAIVTLLAAILGLGIALLVAGGITRPVRLLLEGTRDVAAGRLDREIDVSTRDEIGELSAAFNGMLEQLRRHERIRETFGRYIDPKIVEGLIDGPELGAVEGQRRVMTVLFCDMKGFTAISEGMTPQGLVKIVNHYLSTMSEPVRDHRGTIDKYIGDAVMAYWGPPFVEEAEEARLACEAALDMAGRIPALRAELPELLGLRRMASDCDVRIGIATGEALAGSIGSEFMMNFTVMGDPVNLASRLEALNKVYGTRILISEQTALSAGRAFELREVDRVSVVGQTATQSVYELLGGAGELTREQIACRARYAEGVAAYRERRWEEARQSFAAALEHVGDDGPAQAMLQRLDSMPVVPDDWDGAWHFDHK